MELKDAIYGRRSVRKYKPDAIPHALLEEILQAACMAPSGVNLQPWYFVVIESPEKVKEYTDLMSRSCGGFRSALEARFPDHPEVVEETITFMSTMGGAPVIVLAFFNKPSFNQVKKSDAALQSVAAALQNLQLMAWDRGIGSCWMSAAFAMGVDRTLEQTYAPDKGQFIAAVSLGYPDQEPKAPRRKDGRIHWL